METQDTSTSLATNQQYPPAQPTTSKTSTPKKKK